MAQLNRRTLQIATLTIVLLAVFALLFIDTLNRPRETVAVWVMTRSVAAGGALDASAVRLVHIPAGGESMSYLAASPVGKVATHLVAVGDVVRADDVTGDPVVTVPIKLNGYGPAAGDSIDIYLADAGKVTLIGRGVSYVGSGAIEVPASDEPLWVALYGSSTTLIATRSTGAGVDSSAVSANDAARRLGSIAAGGSAQ